MASCKDCLHVEVCREYVMGLAAARGVELSEAEIEWLGTTPLNAIMINTASVTMGTYTIFTKQQRTKKVTT